MKDIGNLFIKLLIDLMVVPMAFLKWYCVHKGIGNERERNPDEMVYDPFM